MLNNLRFADDIVLISKRRKEVIEMIEELRIECAKVRLRMNASKTKIMSKGNKEKNITPNN